MCEKVRVLKIKLTKNYLIYLVRDIQFKFKVLLDVALLDIMGLFGVRWLVVLQEVFGGVAGALLTTE